MTENNIPADRLHKPEQAVLAYNAGFRHAIIDKAIQDVRFALQLVLMNAPTQAAPVQAVSRQPEPQSAHNASSAPAQPYMSMPEYQVQPATPLQSQFNGDGASMDMYTQASAATNDAYLNALAEPSADATQTTDTDWQPHTMTNDAQALADEARRQLAEMGN